jgi:hypothetical protein
MISERGGGLSCMISDRGGRGSRSRSRLSSGFLVGKEDRDDGGADGDRHTRRDQDVADDAGPRDRELDGGLGGLDLHDDLVDGDGVAGRDVPLEHFGLGEALTSVG